MPTSREAAARWYLGGEQPSRRALVRACLIDGLLVLISILGTFGLTLTPFANNHPMLVVGTLLVVPTVLIRRSFPHVGMVLGAGSPVGFVFAYTAGTRMQSWRRAFAAILLATVPATLVTAMTIGDEALRDSWPDALTSLVIVTIPYLIGVYRGQRQRLLSALRTRNQHLERERILLVREAQLRERSRIARDMHDGLGHHLSLISLRIGGLQVSPRLSDSDRETTREIHGTVHAAMEELRDILDVLKDRDDVQDRVQPLTRARVEEMVTAARGAGQDVRLQYENEPKPLPPRTEQAAYRLLQEGLTNARRHAPGAEATLVLSYGEDSLAVAIVNTAPQGKRTMPRSSGQGLAGLAERIRFAGGTLEAAKSPDGGFRLAAVLPYDQSRMATDSGSGPDAGTDVSPDFAPGPAPGPVACSARPDPRNLDGLGLRSGTGTWVEPSTKGRRVIGIVLAVTAGLSIIVPVVLGYLFIASDSVTRSQFDSIRTGATEDDVRSRLQVDEQVPGKDWNELKRQAPTVPAGADCWFFRSQDELHPKEMAYRLCFREGALVEKVRFPVSSG